jgi:hypothetical protein
MATLQNVACLQLDTTKYHTDAQGLFFLKKETFNYTLFSTMWSILVRIICLRQIRRRTQFRNKRVPRVEITK